jgi:hypothetical protein
LHGQHPDADADANADADADPDADADANADADADPDSDAVAFGPLGAGHLGYGEGGVQHGIFADEFDFLRLFCK